MPSHPQRPSPTRQATPRTPPAPETINPQWLLKALGLVVTVAAIFSYATLCLLFYQGQWQLVLHPGKPPSGPPPAGAEIVRFGPDATAIPQRAGWWLPAAPGAPYRQLTVLYLRGADGTLSDDAAALASLHTAGLSLFAFNYRGYPATIGQHPTEKRMTEDAEAALQYLLNDRHIAPASIVPYGVGVGAALAVHLAAQHPELPAIILDAPRGDLLPDAQRSPQGFLVPVRLLFHERFPLAGPIAALRTPKLIISRSPAQAAITRHAADPKFTLELPSGTPPTALQPTLRRFLDGYLPAIAVSANVLQKRAYQTASHGSR